MDDRKKGVPCTTRVLFLDMCDIDVSTDFVFIVFEHAHLLSIRRIALQFKDSIQQNMFDVFGHWTLF